MGAPPPPFLFLAPLEVNTIIYILPRNVFVFLLYLVAEGLESGIVLGAMWRELFEWEKMNPKSQLLEMWLVKVFVPVANSLNLI